MGPARTETRQRIHEIAERLRYAPNSAARSLITRRTGSIGVLLPDIHGEFFSEVIRGIDRTAREVGLHLLVSGAHSDRAEMEAALRAMRGRVDGMIVMAPDLDVGGLLRHLPEGLPVVLVNSREPETDVASLTIDNFGGAWEMVTHLSRLGHRRIAIITGAASNHDAVERLRGYRTAMRRAGLAAEPGLEAAGDFTAASGFEAAKLLLRRRSRPTAIFAANDSMAMGALEALRDAGVAVPREMAIAGFDDIPIARFATPPLTSVHVPIAQLGARAMARLLEGNLQGATAPRRELLPTTLMVRASCGDKRQPDYVAAFHGSREGGGVHDQKR